MFNGKKSLSLGSFSAIKIFLVIEHLSEEWLIVPSKSSKQNRADYLNENIPRYIFKSIILKV